MSADELKHRILVVEDEAMVSMLLEDMVLDCGCEIIGPMAQFDPALASAREGEFDLAIPDLNRGAIMAYPDGSPRGTVAAPFPLTAGTFMFSQ